MTSVIGSGVVGDGGGGGAQTVNGVPPDGAGNVQLTAADVGARVASITSVAELIEKFGPASGGVYTINEPFYVAAAPGDADPTIDLGSDRIVCVWPGQPIGDSDRVLITSSTSEATVVTERAIRVRIRNTNTVDATARAIELTGTATRPGVLEDVTLIGKDPGNVTGPLQGYALRRVFTVATTDAARPLLFSGATGNGDLDVTALQVGPAPRTVDHVALEWAAAADAPTAIHVTHASLRIGDRAIRMPDTVALPSADDVVALTSSTLTGIAHSEGFFVTGAGLLDETSPEIFAIGNTGSNSSWSGEAVFDEATPIELTHTGGWDVIPSENGIAEQVAEGPDNERWALTIVGVSDWYLGGTGRVDNIKDGQLVWEVVAQRDSGADRRISVRAQSRPGLLGSWTPVQGSEKEFLLTGNTGTVLISDLAIPAFGFDADTHVRLQVLGDVGTQTNFSRYSLRPSGRP
jgi:hypothetical protein